MMSSVDLNCIPARQERLSSSSVKCAKPGQETRADLPTIGPRTVSDAHAAGLAGIAVEAGRSFILETAETVRLADELGLFILGYEEGRER